MTPWASIATADVLMAVARLKVESTSAAGAEHVSRTKPAAVIAGTTPRRCSRPRSRSRPRASRLDNVPSDRCNSSAASLRDRPIRSHSTIGRHSRSDNRFNSSSSSRNQSAGSEALASSVGVWTARFARRSDPDAAAILLSGRREMLPRRANAPVIPWVERRLPCGPAQGMSLERHLRRLARAPIRDDTRRIPWRHVGARFPQTHPQRDFAQIRGGVAHWSTATPNRFARPVRPRAVRCPCACRLSPWNAIRFLLTMPARGLARPRFSEVPPGIWKAVDLAHLPAVRDLPARGKYEMM